MRACSRTLRQEQVPGDVQRDLLGLRASTIVEPNQEPDPATDCLAYDARPYWNADHSGPDPVAGTDPGT